MIISVLDRTRREFLRTSMTIAVGAVCLPAFKKEEREFSCIRCFQSGRMHEHDYSNCYACDGFGMVTVATAYFWYDLVEIPSLCQHLGYWTVTLLIRNCVAKNEFKLKYGRDFLYSRDGHW